MRIREIAGAKHIAVQRTSPSMTSRPASSWERCFAVLIMLLSTGALLHMLRPEGYDIYASPGGDTVSQAIWFGTYIITCCLLFTRRTQVLDGVSRATSLWLLVGWAGLSLAWSAVPDLTFRRFVAVLGSASFGVYLGTRYTSSELLHLLSWTMGVSAVLSMVFAVAIPSYGLDPLFSGAWRGVYQNKNVLGRIMTLGAMAWLLLVFAQRKHRVIRLGFFILSVALVILTTSKTALVVLAALVCILPLLQVVRWRSLLVVPVSITLVLLAGSVAIWLVGESADLLGLLGRDATLTGRTLLWQLVWEMISRRPWLGYGYSGFWLGPEGPSGYIWHITGWNPPHSHNGLLDLWLELGLVGVLLFGWSFLVNLKRSVMLVRYEMYANQLFPLVFLVFMFLYNITESSIISSNTITWILYCAITIQCCVQQRVTAKEVLSRFKHGELHQEVHKI